MLPADYRQWVLAGSSLGLSYAEGGAQGVGMQMFNTTLIEPTAYRHFVETGEFRDGTMLVLLLQGIGTNALLHAAASSPLTRTGSRWPSRTRRVCPKDGRTTTSAAR